MVIRTVYGCCWMLELTRMQRTWCVSANALMGRLFVLCLLFLFPLFSAILLVYLPNLLHKDFINFRHHVYVDLLLIDFFLLAFFSVPVILSLSLSSYSSRYFSRMSFIYFKYSTPYFIFSLSLFFHFQCSMKIYSIRCK